jgi:hypothetical protein
MRRRGKRELAAFAPAAPDAVSAAAIDVATLRQLAVSRRRGCGALLPKLAIGTREHGEAYCQAELRQLPDESSGG